MRRSISPRMNPKICAFPAKRRETSPAIISSLRRRARSIMPRSPRAAACSLILRATLPGLPGNYGGEDAVRIAERFLGECGYEGLRCVWLSESGAEACAEFAAEPGRGDPVCGPHYRQGLRGKGAVTGLEARDYLQNHRRRTVGSAGLSAEKVERNAARRMDEVETVRLALIPQSGEEMLCWEIRGSFGGRRYIAFVDASSGETAEV